MAADHYQALYRRYRSQRFSEVLGQDHVTRALRNAVREGRVGHAYLFSGPRGTGKTSTARILAKVLNCAAPEDGEPCGKCDNCISVERGLVTDWLLEQDAASKSKVDDMRDLLDRVPLGTSGNRKVIILDEVHMLSQGAENALLKTLEEPPDHVVFVLATTDPQKVRATIRSRTQHFAFHLLPSEVIEDHVRHVISDAGLQLDDVDGAVAHVVRVGGGSARDTLSALDQVAALGSVAAESEYVDAIVDALVNRDAGAVLVAVAEATATGRDPRGLGEAIIGRLRDAFLSVMGAADDHVPVAERPRASQVGEQLGAAGLTRALDVLGEALTELSRKPDPRVVLEVALIRLVRPEADKSIDSVLERLERLERGLPVISGGAGPAPAPSGSAPAAPASAEPAAAAPGPSPAPADAAPAPEPAQPAPPPAAPSAGGGPASAARAVLAAKRPQSGGGRTTTPQPSAPAPTAPDAAGSADAGPMAAPDAGPAAAPPDAAADAGGPTASAPTAAADAGGPTDAGPTGDAAPPSATSDPGPPGTVASAGSAPGGGGSAATAAPSGAVPAAAAETPGGGGSGGVELGALGKVWPEVLASLPISIRSKWRGGEWTEPDTPGVARFAVPNTWHQKACEEGRPDVERALAAQLGEQHVRVQVVADGAPPEPSGAPVGSSQPAEPEDPDLAEVPSLPDANDVATGGVDLLLKEFGGELVEEEPT